MAARFAGLILAGGQGERYGGPKALARLPDGRSFVAACHDALAAGGARPIIATLPFGLEAITLRDAVPVREDVELVSVVLPEAGLTMFDSLKLGARAALAYAGWARLVILPVDHPLVGSATVEALGSTVATAALPRYRGKHGHPVVVGRSVVERVASGDLAGPTLREVLHAVGTVDVTVEDLGVVANCNTPERLTEAWKLWCG